MDDPTSELPQQFVDQVRDALHNLYDPAALQRHPLLAAIGRASQRGDGLSRDLRQALLDAIQALNPGPGVAATSRPWRTYRILELRYIEGHDAAEVMHLVSLSKSHYHREHLRALEAVAALVWERWAMAQRWATLAIGEPASAAPGPDQTRREAELLRADGIVGRIDPLEVVVGVSHMLQPLCARRGTALRLTLPREAPTLVGERVALRQALLVVLTDALMLVDRGSIEVQLRVLPRWLEFQVSGPWSDRLGTNGPGGEASRPFLEALGGHLTYEPPADSSRSWRVRLTFPTQERPTVLVVDNSPEFIRLVELYLTNQDWDVLGAADVDRAATLARQRLPRAILLDVVIPGRDGWELLEELKSLPSTRAIPVVICSVLVEPALALALGAAAYLQKPIDQRQLLAALLPFQSAGSIS